MEVIQPNRYLTVRILYPKSGDIEDILAAVQKVSGSARKFEGLVEIGRASCRERV